MENLNLGSTMARRVCIYSDVYQLFAGVAAAVWRIEILRLLAYGDYFEED